VKAFKYVYNWALGEGVLNPTEEEAAYSTADSFHNMDEFFYFDVTFDKDIIKTAPAVDTPISNDVLQKTDLSNFVKVNGKDVATFLTSLVLVGNGGIISTNFTSLPLTSWKLSITKNIKRMALRSINLAITI